MGGKVKKLSFDCTLPALLSGKVEVSEAYQNFNSNGNPTSFGIHLYFSEMDLSKEIKSRDFDLLKGKLESTFRAWEAKYQKYLDQQHKESRAEHAKKKDREARNAIKDLEGILKHTLKIDDTVDWESIKRRDQFRIQPSEFACFKNLNPPSFIFFTSQGKPTKFKKVPPPEKPDFEKFKFECSWYKRVFRKNEVALLFEARMDEWNTQIQENDKINSAREDLFNNAISFFKSKKQDFENEKKRDNETVEKNKLRYKQKETKAIEEYCDLVLNNSQYPDYFSPNWQLEYKKEGRIAIVEYDLPSPSRIPKFESCQYIKSKDEVLKKEIPLNKQKKLYDSVIYQICIRTIHELFEADAVNALDVVAFNGLVTNINPATGVEETKIIISVLANKEQFMAFDLSHVDPKATFKHMKGVAAPSLVDLTPIPPVIQLDKSDKRFIDGKNIVESLDDSVNLAAMLWDDFEHLIRELFEKEFISNGGEVRVTQASSDGGVDALAFDPDPIRGGKIAIQAKRYTNVVGVAAVRDLYGTVMNEGATKGILVTTSGYGKDSYDFAQGKPLTLLNGSNLLSLLEKHGYQARINIAEARAKMKIQS